MRKFIAACLAVIVCGAFLITGCDERYDVYVVDETRYIEEGPDIVVGPGNENLVVLGKSAENMSPVEEENVFEYTLYYAINGLDPEQYLVKQEVSYTPGSKVLMIGKDSLWPMEAFGVQYVSIPSMKWLKVEDAQILRDIVELYKSSDGQEMERGWTSHSEDSYKMNIVYNNELQENTWLRIGKNKTVHMVIRRLYKNAEGKTEYGYREYDLTSVLGEIVFKRMAEIITTCSAESTASTVAQTESFTTTAISKQSTTAVMTMATSSHQPTVTSSAK